MALDDTVEVKGKCIRLADVHQLTIDESADPISGAVVLRDLRTWIRLSGEELLKLEADLICYGKQAGAQPCAIVRTTPETQDIPFEDLIESIEEPLRTQLLEAHKTKLDA